MRLMTNLFTSLLKAVAVKTPIPFSFNQSGVRFFSKIQGLVKNSQLHHKIAS